jgi:hypothetical protein
LIEQLAALLKRQSGEGGKNCDVSMKIIPNLKMMLLGIAPSI